jgi:hypothetical protein
MRTAESSARVAVIATQDETLRNIELEDDVALGSVLPLEDVENDQPMNRQEFLSENIDAELDNNNDVYITDGIMAQGCSPRAEGTGSWEGSKRAMATSNAEGTWCRLVVTRWPGMTCLQEAWSSVR